MKFTKGKFQEGFMYCYVSNQWHYLYFTCSKSADANIFDKIKDVHGFLKCHYCFIRGATVPPQIMQFFSSVGLPLFQSYGMTEGTMLLIVDFPHKRPGSIGRAVKGCKVRIHQPDKEGVGEVRWRKIWVSTACNLRFFYNYVFFWSARNCSLEKKLQFLFSYLLDSFHSMAATFSWGI